MQRNRARRLLRAAWVQVRGEAKEGTDVVLVARRNILHTGSPAVVEEISRLLREDAR